MVWYEQAITNNGLIWANNYKQRSDMSKPYQTVVCHCLLISDHSLLLLVHIRPLFAIACSYQTVVCYCLFISDRCLLLLVHIRPLLVIVCSYQIVDKQRSDMSKQWQTTVWYEQTITNNSLIWADNNKQWYDMSKLFVIVCSYQTVVWYCLFISNRCLLLLAHIRPLFVIVCSYQTVVCYCLLIYMSKQ
jgi:hypothetical protein